MENTNHPPGRRTRSTARKQASRSAMSSSAQLQTTPSKAPSASLESPLASSLRYSIPRETAVSSRSRRPARSPAIFRTVDATGSKPSGHPRTKLSYHSAISSYLAVVIESSPGNAQNDPQRKHSTDPIATKNPGIRGRSVWVHSSQVGKADSQMGVSRRSR